VTHYASSRFWRAYRALPKEIRDLADAKYELLKADPEHPSLHFKKIGSYWSVRVGLHYRALAAIESDDDVVWFWIGSHADYDVLVGRQPSRKAPRQTARGRKKTKSRRRSRSRPG
jgi:mRNA-degrading endonuclease RelE of RelBE toxin-antitoxin system